MSLFEGLHSKNYSGMQGNMFRTYPQMIPEKRNVLCAILEAFLKFEIILKLTLSLALKKYIYFIVSVSLALNFLMLSN